MISIEEYRADPCGSLSIPYWKAKGMTVPDGMKIVHQRDWEETLSEGYEDRRFFRLRHDLTGIPAAEAAGAGLRVLSPGESGEIAELIDRCYGHLGIRVTQAEVESWAKARVYCPDLWIGAETDGKLVGAVLCDLDREAGEGVIEWLQVLPEYRERGIGGALVRRALSDMIGRAGFATVSGDSAKTRPGRRGFTGGAASPGRMCGTSSGKRAAAEQRERGKDMKQVAVVTGGSSGIGRETAGMLARQGWTVYELSRREIGQPGVTHITADVTREETVAAAAGIILAREGQVDLVVNNAGFGISGAVEFTETREAERQFDVNFFGMVRVNHVFLPILRRQGRGRILNVSSVAAPVAIPFQAYYSAAKAAIESYTLALANEVRPYGVTVCAVRPGDIRTGFTAARTKSAAGDDQYGGRIARSVAVMEKDEQGGMSPRQAAKVICRTAAKKRPKPLTAIGVRYQGVCLLVKLLPCRLANWIVGQIYAK